MYKRQVYTSADDAWEGFRNDYFEDGELLDGVFDGDNPLAVSNHYQVYIKGIEQQAVSYTHLDVYKRQISVRRGKNSGILHLMCRSGLAARYAV